jgi:membrane associated rhomboid family serine protease
MDTSSLDAPRRGRRMPFTLVVVVANLVMWLACLVVPPLRDAMILDGGLVWHGEVWRLFTYAWIHASWAHLLGNMAAFAPFGAYIEARWGRGRLIAAYVLCCLGSGLFLTVIDPIRPQRVLGASGAVSGIMVLWLAGVLSRAGKQWYVILPEVALGLVVAVYYLGRVVLTDVTEVLAPDQISHWAHLGGFATGFLLFRVGLLGRDTRGETGPQLPDLP